MYALYACTKAPRTHFGACKVSKFSGGVPPDSLAQSLLWAPHFVFALGPSTSLDSPAFLGEVIEFREVTM